MATTADKSTSKKTTESQGRAASSEPRPEGRASSRGGTGRVLSGVVVRRSGEMTVVVQVARVWVHPLYSKRQTRTKRYLAHDESNGLMAGQAVEIREVRPLSARKRWLVVSKQEKS